MHQKSISSGALTQTPLGELTAVLLSLALVLGLEVSSRTNFECLALALWVKSLALALRKSPWAWSIRSLALQGAAISQTNTLTVLKHFHRN